MRRIEPKVAEVLRFIADYEALDLTCEHFPTVSEADIRALIGRAAEELGPRRSAKKAAQRVEPGADGALKVVVNTDGASRGNPGPAGAGWVIREPSGTVLQASGAFLGRRTNN